MIELKSAKRIQSLKSGSEAVTGETYTDLTEGVQALKDGYGQGGAKEEQEKAIDITENGTTDVLPDDGKVLSKVTVSVDVPDKSEEVINGIEAKIDESGILYGTEKTIDEKVDGLIDVAKIYGQSSTLSFANRSLTSIDFYIPYTGTGCVYMFANTPNLKHMVGINTSKVTDFTWMFQNSGIEVIDEPLDFSSAKGANAFAGNTTIREVRLVAGSLKISAMFPSANLSDGSVQSIIDGLADLTGGTQQTLTLSATVTAKLTEEQIATITNKNWVVA